MVKAGEGLSIKSLVILKPNHILQTLQSFLLSCSWLPCSVNPISSLLLVQLQLPRAPTATGSVTLSESAACLATHAHQRITDTWEKGREKKHIIGETTAKRIRSETPTEKVSFHSNHLLHSVFCTAGKLPKGRTHIRCSLNLPPPPCPESPPCAFLIST